ncbi:hypothetical protein CK203_041841 [Vitis vinifera]|uniref:UBN2 domain-containing protein n=1 Tax=Vitis vinifera TaxID=29760 RepID=A0A438FYE9_VITVI|nr:hypothetical protein CK203_041841 [Vitis vinifera]
MANWLNRLRNRSTGCARPVEDRSRKAKKFLSPNSLLFPVEGILFPIEVRLRIGRGNEMNTIEYVNANQLRNLELLEITHEGTNQVTDIVNGLEALEKTYKESEKVMKILKSLLSKWNTKATAIQEAKDLTKLPMEELIRSSMTYEINLTKKLQEGEDKKKKSIALKATTKEE